MSSPPPTSPKWSSDLAVPAWLQRAGAVSWRVLVVGAAVYYAGQTLGFLHIVVVPFALALFVAALLEPVARWFKKVMPASLATFLALFLGTGLLSGVLVIVGVNVAQRAPEMGEALMTAWDSLVRFIEKLPFGPDQGELGDSLRSLGADLGSQVGALTKGVVSGAQSFFVLVSQLLLTLAFGFFLMRDGEALFDQFARRFDGGREERVHAAGEHAWMTLGKYFRGLALIALANALMTAGALLLIGIPLVVPIAVLMFIGSFVPFAGPVVAGAVGALVALTHGGLTDALLIIAANVAIQGIEGNVLQPFIIGRTLELHPLAVLAGVTTGAIVAGLGGAFVAIPLMAAVKNAVGAARSADDEAAATDSTDDPDAGDPARDDPDADADEAVTDDLAAGAPIAGPR